MDASVADSAQSSTTYRLTSKQRMLGLGFGAYILLAIVGLSLLLSFTEHDPEWFPVMTAFLGVLFGPFIVLLVVYAFRSRLVLSPSGIEVLLGGSFAKTSWDNVDRIGEISVSVWAKPRQGLILREPAIRYKWWVVRKVRRQFSESGQDRFIDLQAFTNDWRNSDLGREVRRYAPRLFETETALSNPPEAASLSTEAKEEGKIGGWLITVGIWLAVNLVSSLVVIGADSVTLFSLFEKTTTPFTKPMVPALIVNFSNPLINYALIFEITTNALLASTCGVLLVLLFQKSRLFVKTGLGFIAMRLFFGLANFFFINYARQAMGAEMTSMLTLNGLTLSTVVFMRYLTTSKRVKETFAN